MRIFIYFLVFLGFLISPATFAQPQTDLHVEELWQYGRGVIDDFVWDDHHLSFPAGGKIWEVDPRAGQSPVVSTTGIFPLSTSPDNQRSVTWEQGEIVIRDTSTNEIITTIPHYYVDKTSIAWQPDTHFLTTLGYNEDNPPVERYYLELWDTDSGELVITIGGYAENIIGFSWHPAGELLAVSLLNNKVMIEDTTLHRQMHELRVDVPPNRLAWSPDGTKLAATRTHVKLWRTDTFDVIPAPNESAFVFSLAWDADSTRLAGSLMNSGIGIWNTETNEFTSLGVETFLDSTVFEIGWQGNLLAELSPQHLRVWNTTNEKLVWDSTEHQFHPAMQSLAVSRDGTLAALGYRDSQKIDIIDTGNSTLIQTLMLPQSLDISDIAWSPSDEMLAIGNSEGVFLWQPNENPLTHPIQFADLDNPEFSWSPDSVLAVSDRTWLEEKLLLIDGEAGKLLPTMREMSGLYYPLWSPDGRYIALYRYSRLTGDEVDPSLKQIDILDVQRDAMTTIQFASSDERVIVPLEDVVWLPDSSGLMGYTNQGGLWRWHVGDEQAELLTSRPAIDTTNQSFWLSINARGDLLAISNPATNYEIHILDARSGEVLLRLDDLVGATSSFAWGGDDLLIVYDGVLRGFRIR